MKIDIKKKFPHLRKAPVVEAVIEFRARALSTWDETTTPPLLRAALPGYQKAENLFTVSLTLPFPVNPAAPPPGPPPAAKHSSDWAGLRLTSNDSTQVAAFKRDGLTFSRLPPYTRWSALTTEALRLWAIQAEVSGATQIERIGVRFINRLEVPTKGLKFGQYFNGLGTVPGGLPLSNFVSHRTIEVPDHPYTLILIQTIQAPPSPEATSLGLITDIDVVALEPIVNDRGIILRRLKEMRVLKNTLFFDSVTEKYLRLCR